MKKFLAHFAFFLLAVGLALTSANGLITKSVTATSGGVAFIFPDIVRGVNDSVIIDGDFVTVHWMTNRFMDGKVIIEGASSHVVYETGGPATYHTVNFYLSPGKYTIQPISTYIMQTFKAPIKEIVIEGYEEPYYDDYIPEEIIIPFEYTGYEFKDHLLQEQIEELLELYYKPMELWNLNDRANWAYATL